MDTLQTASAGLYSKGIEILMSNYTTSLKYFESAVEAKPDFLLNSACLDLITSYLQRKGRCR